MKKDAPQEVKKELLKLIKGQKWTRAKTYEETAPHEYFLEKQNKALYDQLKEMIKEYGKDEPFQLFNKKDNYRYFYFGKYRYWAIEEVMNRALVENIVHKDGVSMQILKKK